MSSKRYAKDRQIAARVSTAVKDVAQEMAAEDGMSLASFVEYLIRKEAERRKKPIKVVREGEE